jgi:hypothetical protein
MLSALVAGGKKIGYSMPCSFKALRYPWVATVLITAIYETGVMDLPEGKALVWAYAVEGTTSTMG